MGCANHRDPTRDHTDYHQRRGDERKVRTSPGILNEQQAGDAARSASAHRSPRRHADRYQPHPFPQNHHRARRPRWRPSPGGHRSRASADARNRKSRHRCRWSRAAARVAEDRQQVRPKAAAPRAVRESKFPGSPPASSKFRSSVCTSRCTVPIGAAGSPVVRTYSTAVGNSIAPAKGTRSLRRLRDGLIVRRFDDADHLDGKASPVKETCWPIGSCTRPVRGRRSSIDDHHRGVVWYPVR